MANLRNLFPSQQNNESVFMFLRRDILNFLPMALIILFLFSFGIVSLFLFALPGTAVTSGWIRNVFAVAVPSYLLLVGLFGFIAWLDFYFDVHILTSLRLVDIDQNRLFSRSIAELALDDIEDVKVTRNGILETVANFGDVLVQTAGEKPNFLLDKISFPQEVAALILDLSEQTKAGVVPLDRIPRGNLKGIIDNKLIFSDDFMHKIGAVIPGQGKSASPLRPPKDE